MMINDVALFVFAYFLVFVFDGMRVLRVSSR